MTREQAEKHKEVIQHFINGGEVEWFNELSEKWEYCECPNWYTSAEYRIKQEPKYVPFDFSDAEQLIGKCVKSKDGSIVAQITYVSDKYVVYCDYNTRTNYEYIFNNFTFLDGTPCGKLKQ